MELIGRIILIIIGLVVLSILLKFLGWLIGVALIPALITWVFFGNPWIGVVIGIILGIWMAIRKENERHTYYHTCRNCHSTDTEEMTWDEAKREISNYKDADLWIRCRRCGKYSGFSKDL